MEFGPLPSGETIGCILGHTLRLPGRVLKKGRPLGADEVAAIVAAGIETVTVARLGSEDTAEDPAALRMAQALAGPKIECERPFTGRSNLRATVAGILRVDMAGVESLHAIDEALTVATLPSGTTVWPEQLVATAKVIPFAVPTAVLERWEERAREAKPYLSVAPFLSRSATFVQTRLDGTPEQVLDRACASMETRLSARGSQLQREVRCAHREDDVSRSILSALDAGTDLVMILGASQIADRDDVVPRAVVQAGGVVHRFGLPVDPGNLTLIASIGEVPVLGVPGCARSLRPSGFDMVLDRTLAGTRPEAIEVLNLGVGGLLKEIASRPQPRRSPSGPETP